MYDSAKTNFIDEPIFCYGHFVIVNNNAIEFQLYELWLIYRSVRLNA